MSVKTIAVMGPTGSGKSTFINSFFPPGSSSGVRVGRSLQSETREIQSIELNNGKGLGFKLVDTPGFDDSREGITDIDVLSMIATFLVQEEERSIPLGLIYMHRISDTRMGGAARRNLRMFHKICGQDSLKNVVIVTTMWDKVTPEEGERHEQELRSSKTLFKPLLDGGAVMHRHYGTLASALEIVDSLLYVQDHTTTQIVQELLYEQKTLEETSAGTEIQSELRAILQKHSADIKRLEEESRSATAASTKDEIAVQKKGLELLVSKLNWQIEDLKRRSGAGERAYFPPARSSSLDVFRNPTRNESLPPHDVNYPYYRNDPAWGRSLPPPINPLLVSPADYITNCTQLLHLANRIQNIQKMTPTRDDIVNSIRAWTSDFARVLGESVDNAQHGIDALGSMVELRESHQVQKVASNFINTMKDTEREWRSTHMTMARKCGEYRAALHAEQRTTLAMLLLGGGRRYFYVLQAITGVMRLVLADMNSTIEWWASISDRAGAWGDVTREQMSGNDLNDYVRGESASVIRALGSYREAYQNISQELRRSSELSAGSDGGNCEGDKSQAALLPTTDYLVRATPKHSKLRRSGYSPRSQPPRVESKGVTTTPSSIVTL